MNKKKKIAIVVVIVALIAAIIGTGFYVTDNKTSVGNKLLLTMMPKSISGVTADGEMTFYVEKNKDYNPKENSDSPMDGFTFYYFNSKDERVDIGDSGYYVDSSGTKHSVMAGFITEGLATLNSYRTAVKVVFAIAIVGAIVGLIFLWYKVWSKKEDEKKAELYNKK